MTLKRSFIARPQSWPQLTSHSASSLAAETGRADKGDGSRVDEHPIEHKWWQAERVVAVEVGEEDHLDGPGIDTAAVHVGQKWGSSVQQEPAVDDHCPVVSLGRECRAGAEKG